MRPRTLIFATFTAYLLSCSLFAQEPAQEPPKPVPVEESKPAPAKSHLKIGVALEGGGALGEAHIGVLKWFEEHHIPIDYLSGTSMGGLVGGLYSTGKSADDLRHIVETADWPLLLRGGTPYEDLIFRRKEDAREVPNAIQIGLKHGLSLPPGLNSGQQITLLIDRETIAYSSLPSFDDLPIPFRCVSTELVSGKAYVFQDGSLSDALRATISIPGLFAPLRRGDKIFVDGGIVDNLPTDVVRKMGADVVIAVHLQIAKANAKEIQSAFSILGRSVELVVAESELRGMAGADLIVRANVEDFSTMDYNKSNQLIQIGYDAAAAKEQILKPYELNDADWAEYQKKKHSRFKSLSNAPNFVKVDGVDERAAQSIQDFLTPLLGKPLKASELDEKLTRLSGIGRYESITYDMPQENGQTGLLIHVQEKTYAPPLLQPSFVIDGSQTNDVTFTMGGRLTFMDVAGYRSEWRTDFEFGETYGIQSQLFKPIHPLSKWFVMPFLNAEQTGFNVYYKSDPRAIYRLDNVLGGVDFGYAFNRFNELRIGYAGGYENYTLRLGQPEFSSFNGAVAAVQLRYIRDHTNEAIIPTNGHYIRLNFRWYNENPGAAQAFPAMELFTSYYHSVSEKGSIFLNAQGGSTFGSSNIGTPLFFLGGIRALSAYGDHELYGNQYFLGRTGYLHKMFTLPPFVGKQVYLSAYGEVGKMYGDSLAPRLSADVASGIIAETAVGPVFIGGSVGDTGHQKWFFQLGRLF
jgi:NTE family protein